MGQTAAKRVTAKNPHEKLAHRRMTVLELAERLGNVSEACRRGGIDRTSFYDWKRRFQLQGLDGLKDLPPVAKSHPMTTPVEVVARLLELAAHPRPRASSSASTAPCCRSSSGPPCTGSSTKASRSCRPTSTPGCTTTTTTGPTSATATRAAGRGTRSRYSSDKKVKRTP
jgi:hypothetical protein